MKKVVLVLTFLCNVVLAIASVESTLEVGKMDMINGNTSYQKVKDANPGDTLVYTLKLTNNTAGVIKDITPSIPIPEYTTLDSTMVMPNNFMVSTDGKEYMVYPYVGSDGRPVDDSMYKSVRWTVDSMKPKEVREFKFGVKVN